MKSSRNPKSPRPDNAILARRKRIRKRAERDANPDVIFARIVEANRHARRAAGRRLRRAPVPR